MKLSKHQACALFKMEALALQRRSIGGCQSTMSRATLRASTPHRHMSCCVRGLQKTLLQFKPLCQNTMQLKRAVAIITLQ